MKLSLVVSTYNQPVLLAKVLRAVALQSQWPDEVIVADDGSPEPVKELVASWQQRAATLVRHIWQPHEGFRKTRILNKAIQAAGGDYIVLLDGDCAPHQRFVADHRRLAEKGFWVQGRRCFVRQAFVEQFEPGQMPVWRWLLTRRIGGGFKVIRLPFPVVHRNTGQRGIIGCNMGIWREDLLAINGFDESYTGWGGEDSDLGSRLYHLGRPRKFVYGHAVVYHLDHPPVSRDRFPDNREKLEETLRSRKIRCERGVQQYF